LDKYEPGKKKRSRCGCAESTKGGGWRRQAPESPKPIKRTPNSLNYEARHCAAQAELVRCRIGIFMGQWLSLIKSAGNLC
jgi:hypothetical protein